MEPRITVRHVLMGLVGLALMVGVSYPYTNALDRAALGLTPEVVADMGHKQAPPCPDWGPFDPPAAHVDDAPGAVNRG